MKRFSCLFLLLTSVLMFSSSGFSQHKLESWYTYWGLGYANQTYEDDLRSSLDEFENLDGVTHASIALDLLGFYWPIGEKTIIGGILNLFGDRYEIDNSSLDLDSQISGVTVAFSTMYYLTDKIGKGLFIRGDAGPARYAVEVGGLSGRSKWGFGVLIGGGFAFPVSDGTRILLNVNYAARKVESEKVNTLGITIGGLF